MSTVMKQQHPAFHVHDRHPMLHGLPVLLLCLAFLVAFLFSVVPGVGSLLGHAEPPQQAGDLGR
jgi:hypothetical protein